MWSKCEKIWKKSLKNQKRPEKIRKDLKRPEKSEKIWKIWPRIYLFWICGQPVWEILLLLQLRDDQQNRFQSESRSQNSLSFLTDLDLWWRGRHFWRFNPDLVDFPWKKGDKQKFTSSELRHSHSINNKNNKTCQNFPPTFPSLVISFTSLEENLSTNKFQIVSLSLKFFIATLWCICCRYTVSIKPSRKIEDLPIICCKTKTCIFTWTTYQNISDYIKSVIKSWAKKCNYLRRKKHSWIKSLPHALANKNNIAWGQQGKLSIF